MTGRPGCCRAMGDPWRDLIAVLLLQAMADLTRAPWLARDAHAFLAGDDGRFYAALLHIDHAALMAVVERRVRERGA